MISLTSLHYLILRLLATAAAATGPSALPLDLNLNSFPLLPRDLSTGTCDSQTPCVNAACCGTTGLCGYSPTECGSGNCTSNCDAKAQCGLYAVEGQRDCPLNVCCSQFGFCGSTDDFCNNGCQAGYGSCGPPKRPACGISSTSKRSIGYYESWANARKCQSVAPEDLNLNGFTHINFAFAFFDPSSFAIAPMDSTSSALYNRFTALKNKRPGLQTWISIGGWSFTDPGPTRTAFSDMTSSSASRQNFINGLRDFMQSYGFDGVDLDWEYPQADDRGGVTRDKENYVSLVKELRAAFGPAYGISMTLPTSYWYLQHFDLIGIQDNVDWFNLMSYDLHGVWDAESQFVGPYLAPHTNITEIDLGLDLLWRAGVRSEKVILGQSWYGRSFTLKDSSCNTPNKICEFTGGANPGPCSNAAGILNNQEIQTIISNNRLSPHYDKSAAVKWIAWDDNQWVSYDDDETFQQKRDFASSRCLGGLMVWAIDQVNQIVDNDLAPAPGVTTDQQKDAQQMSKNLQAGITCYTTSCGANCKKGTNAVAQMSGQPSQLSTNTRCEKGVYRTLCCDDGTLMGSCQWRGFRGLGLSCINGCDDGETEVVTDTNHHKSNGDQTCTGGLQSYCCRGFRPVPSRNDVQRLAKDSAKAAAESAAENAALDLAAKAFCRVAVPALLAPLELLEDLIPIVGIILDIAEVAATPALINLCVKGVEKEGKAEFKVFGKKHTLSMNEPTKKPSNTRPSTSSHTSAKTRSDSCPAPAGAAVKRMPKACRQKTIYETTRTTYVSGDVVTRICNAGAFKQPCLHYNSVVRGNPDYDTLPCYTTSPANFVRPAVRLWSIQHVDGWRKAIDPLPSGGCQADEWPPANFWQGNNGQQWIRYIPGNENRGAGQLWNKLCPKKASFSTENDARDKWITNKKGNLETVTIKCTVSWTRRTMFMDFINQAGFEDDGLAVNPCFPNKLVDDPGFALLTSDPWYELHPAAQAKRVGYSNPPSRKRDGWFDPDLVFLEDRNKTRKLTDEELRERFGFVRCSDRQCSQEKGDMGIESALMIAPPLPSPAPEAAPVTTTPANEANLGSGSPPEAIVSATIPLETGLR